MIESDITYTLRLSSGSDPTDYITLPCKSAAWRGIYGGQCTLTAVVPGFDYADEIEELSGGELQLWRSSGGGEAVEVAAAILEKSVTHEGPTSQSINLTATISGVFLPDPGAITIENVSYRSDSRTDGSWSYRLPVVDPDIIPGATVVYGEHEFDVEEVVINVEPTRETMSINELSYAGGLPPDPGGGTEACTIEIPMTYNGNHSMQYNCKFRGAEIYYRNFVISGGGVGDRVSVSVSGGLTAQLTSGYGISAYGITGVPMPYRLIAEGASFVGDIFDTSYYNIQVRHEGAYADGMSFTLDVAPA